MLYYQTIDSSTLELLKQLQEQPAFKNLRLVGGTSLALQIGHRISVDIDLFGNIEADEFEVLSQINSIAPVTILKKSKNINIFLIKGVKVDIVNYNYPWLSQPISSKDLVLASLEDIAAMKLSAITGRGTRKDFIDMFFLLKHFSLQQMLDFYHQKYKDGNEFLVLKSLMYFEDAEQDEFPVMLIPQDWEAIKLEIKTLVNNFLQSQSVQ